MERKHTLGMSRAVFCGLIIGLMFGLISLSSASLQAQSRVGKNPAAETGEAKVNSEGALNYEYERAKDPATGKIPEGIFEAERAQANAVLNTQKQTSVSAFASYSVVGPNNLGGRTRTLAYDVRYDGATNRTIFAGGVSGGVYKSVDDGATWVRKSPTGDHFSCTSIAQDTRVGFQDTWWTRIGGYANSTSYSIYPNSHPDFHSFVFQPGSPATMLTGNGGGIQRTADDLAAAVAWTPINNGYRTYQYYYVANDPRINNNANQ